MLNAETMFKVYSVFTKFLVTIKFATYWIEFPLRLYVLYIGQILKSLEQQGKLKSFQVLENTLLIALDGVEYFSSQKIHCPQCSTKTLTNGDIHYSHSAVTPVIVAPHQTSVIPLAPEFVVSQDGNAKQDYELAAAKRWLMRENTFLPKNVTFMGDDLYCKQPFCQQVLQLERHFILVCRPESHKTLYEWIEDFERTCQIGILEKTHWTGKQRQTLRYRFVNQVPLRNSDDALLVNWCEIEIRNDKGKRIYRNAFATDYLLHVDNIEAIVGAGRTRWKIENENNNTLKTKGYHFEHNFGHGQHHLAALLASLNILAYLVHTLLEWFDIRYRLLRQKLVKRKTFFDDIRALTTYMSFDSWRHLMEFMLTAKEIPLPEDVYEVGA
jgi:hypothetical protein